MAAPPRQLRSWRSRRAQLRPSYPLSGHLMRQVQNQAVPSPTAESGNSPPMNYRMIMNMYWAAIYMYLAIYLGVLIRIYIHFNLKTYIGIEQPSLRSARPA